MPLVTLSNLGTHGVRWFTGIIPLGQRGLLTTGSLEQRCVVRKGRLGVGWELSAVLNVDHRVWDGADAAVLLRPWPRRSTPTPAAPRRARRRSPEVAKPPFAWTAGRR